MKYHPTRVALVAAPLFAKLLDKVKPDEFDKMQEQADMACVQARILLDRAHGL